jgi:hypothetical protein
MDLHLTVTTFNIQTNFINYNPCQVGGGFTGGTDVEGVVTLFHWSELYRMLDVCKVFDDGESETF